MKYTVYVDDNFHYTDEDERYKKGEYDSFEEAVSVCKRMVDEFLIENYKPGRSADDLFSCYRGYGEDPFVISDDPEAKFSAWKYAKQRCDELCGENQPALFPDW